MKTNSAWQKTLQACDSQALIKASGCKWSILQTALLYFHSIRPGATRTDLVISWHRIFKTHVEQCSIWVWADSLNTACEGLMLKASWCRKSKCADRLLHFHLFSRRLKMWSTDQWENWFWTGHWWPQQSTCLSRNMLTLVKFWTEPKVLTSTGQTRLQSTAHLFVILNYLSSSWCCFHIID